MLILWVADDAKRLIFRRRARFVAMALASAGIAGAGQEGCGGQTESDSSKHVVKDAASDQPQPCLSAPQGDSSTPEPCLGRPLPEDAGNELDATVAADADIDVDAAPEPCLSPPAP